MLTASSRLILVLLVRVHVKEWFEIGDWGWCSVSMSSLRNQRPWPLTSPREKSPLIIGAAYQTTRFSLNPTSILRPRNSQHHWLCSRAFLIEIAAYTLALLLTTMHIFYLAWVPTHAPLLELGNVLTRPTVGTWAPPPVLLTLSPPGTEYILEKHPICLP